MEDTIFGKIIRHEIPAHIIYEDSETLAFLDIKPISAGHTLVLPKKASRNLFDIDEESAVALMRTIRIVTKAVKAVTNADGINVSINNESAAGQIIFHTHAHIIPRFKEDGLKNWNRQFSYKEGEDITIAEKIRTHLS